jgi:hypothetical protein
VRRIHCFLVGTAAWAASGGPVGALDFTSLQALLQHEHIETIEQLLPVLPEAQRSHYTLMFESRSLQGASIDNPRVILFGPDGRFILTFNGSPDQPGFSSVETMEFDAYTQAFRLRELQFAEPGRGGTPIVVSEPNPTRCTRCHGSPARPVWDTMPLWPGAYGERYRASLSPEERAGLSAFLAKQPTHPRYRYLLDAQRLSDPGAFRASAPSVYSGRAAEPPNAELAADLARLQSQAIARRLATQPLFPVYQYALLGAVDSGCGPLADFYPAALWRGERRAFERFATETEVANARQAQLKGARGHGGGTRMAPVSVSTVNAWVPLRFVAEMALGIPTRGWTLALESGTYDFTAPPLPTQPLRDALLAEMSARDPMMLDLVSYASARGAARYCAYLQRRSIAALSARQNAAQGMAAAPYAPAAGGGGQGASLDTADVAPAVPAAEAATTLSQMAALVRPAALQMCVNCHETGPAPSLPFSDPARLTHELQARPAAHGVLLDEILFRLSAAAGPRRMPLGINLPDEERRALERYFTTLAASSK